MVSLALGGANGVAVALEDGYVMEAVAKSTGPPELTGPSEPTSASEPVPNAPELPSPQHCTPPVENTAHECDNPRAMLRAVARPCNDTTLTENGVELLPTSAVLPMPSCPLSFSPQHLTSPLVRMTHVCSPPHATATAKLCNPNCTIPP